MHRKRRGARETSPDVLIAQPPIDNSYPQLPPGVPIARGLISESSFAPNSSHFRSDSRFPPGFDYRHSFHEVKMMFQESLKGSSGEGVWALPHIQESWEITSDRPFLPRKRSPPRDANITNSSSRISKGDKRGDRIEEPCGPSLSPRTLASADGPIAQDTSQGRAMQLLPTGKKNKTKKQSAENIQPACAGPPSIRRLLINRSLYSTLSNTFFQSCYPLHLHGIDQRQQDSSCFLHNIWIGSSSRLELVSLYYLQSILTFRCISVTRAQTVFSITVK